MRLAASRPGRHHVVAVLLTSLALATTGCTKFSDLQFQIDHYVKFTAPEARSKTTLPLTLQWQVDGFRVAPPNDEEHYEPPSKNAGYFALFVDRAPIKPGQTLAAVAGDDTSCVPSAGCPDREYLRDRQVYVTTDLRYTLRQVFTIEDNNDDWQLHDVTIILLDTDGHRIGEHAYYREFKLKRESLT
jgi:hypothetical protein